MLLGRISPNEAGAFSMRTAKRPRFSPESKRFTLKALLRYAQDASVAGSLRMTDSGAVRAGLTLVKFLSCSKVKSLHLASRRKGKQETHSWIRVFKVPSNFVSVT